MNVSLTSELEKFVHKEVASNRYQTASEVVRHALRQMQTAEEYDKARLEALQQDIHVGQRALDQGEFIEIKNEKDRNALLTRIKRDGRAKLAGRTRRKSA